MKISVSAPHSWRGHTLPSPHLPTVLIYFSYPDTTGTWLHHSYFKTNGKAKIAKCRNLKRDTQKLEKIAVAGEKKSQGKQTQFWP